MPHGEQLCTNITIQGTTYSVNIIDQEKIRWESNNIHQREKNNDGNFIGNLDGI